MGGTKSGVPPRRRGDIVWQIEARWLMSDSRIWVDLHVEERGLMSFCSKGRILRPDEIKRHDIAWQVERNESMSNHNFRIRSDSKIVILFWLVNLFAMFLCS